MTTAEPPPVEDKKKPRFIRPLENKDYQVRVYDPPPLEDLEAYKRLIVDFEKRFFRNADRGHEVLGVTDINQYIEQKSTAYEHATGPEKDLEGGMLRIALIRRGVDHALQHIQMRIDAAASKTPADGKKLDELYENIGKDFMAAYNLPALRLSRGQPDVDDVLGEMQGEPLKLFSATLTGSADMIKEFYRSRYGKTAEAMECIDKITQSMRKLDTGRGGYHNQQVQGALVRLADAAKERMQLQRGDPDFHDADVALRSARNDMQDLLLNTGNGVPIHLPGDRKKQGAMDPLETTLARSALNLVYDVAMTHDAQNHRAKELAASVESFVRREQSRGRATP
jgi:hypothetical protein